MLREVIFSMKVVLKNSIAAVSPRHLIPSEVQLVNKNQICIRGNNYSLDHNVYIVGFGKAVYGMAYEIEKLLGPHIKKGIISIPVGMTKQYKDDSKLTEGSKIAVYEGAANNLPDLASANAAFEIYEMVKDLKENDLLVVLVSGGGSALLSLPPESVSISDKSTTVKLLASSGADIVEINVVRKRLSALKGGKLARLAYPAKVASLIISDVIGDPLEYIASGPTVPNNDAPEDAMNIVKKYDLYEVIPGSVRSVLTSQEESAACGDFSHVLNVIIGNNSVALHAAKQEGEKLGYTTIILSDRIEGLILDVAYFYTNLIGKLCKYLDGRLSALEFKYAIREPSHILPMKYQNDSINNISENLQHLKNKTQFCFVAGGEPTVRLMGSGLGGRNQELALRIGLGLQELKQEHSWLTEKFEIVFLSAGTDGIDGPTDAAGAVSYTDMVAVSQEQNLDPVEFLKNSDSYTFFTKLNAGKDHIKLGHTGTNVMDIHLIVIRIKE